MASLETGDTPSTKNFPPLIVGDNGEEGGTQRRKKILVIVSVFLLLAAVLGAAWYWWMMRNRALDTDEEIPTNIIQDKPKNETSIVPQTETTEIVPLFGDANFVSENFRVGEIAIGGEAEFLLTDDDPSPLEVLDIRGEAFSEKNKQSVKLVLNWRTNKLAVSDIEYSKGVGQRPTTLAEEDYGRVHSVVIPGLEQSATYIYTIKTRDRFGNEKVSDPHAVYTGAKTVSLFDLIADAVGEVFGWAVRKN